MLKHYTTHKKDGHTYITIYIGVNASRDELFDANEFVRMPKLPDNVHVAVLFEPFDEESNG